MPQILIIDDKQIIRRLLYDELTNANFQVVTLNTIGLIWEYIREIAAGFSAFRTPFGEF